MARWTHAAALLAATAWGFADPDEPSKPPEVAAADPIAGARAAAESEEGDREAAAATLRAFLNEHPADPHAPEARFWLGFCQVRLGENESALETLRPFESLLGGDAFATRALVELGTAYHETLQNDLAMTAWKRVLDDNRSRGDEIRRAAAGSIRVLEGTNSDPSRCRELCERVLELGRPTEDELEAPTDLDFKFIGGSCLNLLKQTEACDAWILRWFVALDPLDEAKRRILDAQRMILNAREEDGLKGLDAIDNDFADLDLEQRVELTLLTVQMLRKSNRVDLAGRRITAALENPLMLANEAAVERLFDELAAVNAGELRPVLITTLSTMASDAGRPLTARLTALDRLATLELVDERAEAAAAVLRDALGRETAELARFRIGTRLAEILDDDLENPAEARKVLDDLKTKLRRRDLLDQVEDQIVELDAV
ncbi:MAG: hypothetical protein KGM43_03385 [Planctomycetota bacterium]|nr:hypothetical protein [Planctomycetota bacterium]